MSRVEDCGRFRPAYPTDERGLALPPYELDFPDSKIDYELLAEGEPYVNNHHRYYEAAWYAGHLLLRTFRNLAVNVDPLPIDTHRRLHQAFSGVVPPDAKLCMEMVELEYLNGGLVHSSNTTKDPKPLTDALVLKCSKNYKEIQRYGY